MQGKLQIALLEREAGPAAGGRREDGTVFVGVSPDTGRALFAAAADLSLSSTFNQMQDLAASFIGHGHRDWRPPTKNELRMIFDNRAAIGGFDKSGTYWSITQDTSFSAWCQRFSDGKQAQHGVDMRHALRPVRG